MGIGVFTLVLGEGTDIIWSARESKNDYGHKLHCVPEPVQL